PADARGPRTLRRRRREGSAVGSAPRSDGGLGAASEGWTLTYSPVATKPTTAPKSEGLAATEGLNPAALQAEPMRWNHRESSGSSVAHDSSASSFNPTAARSANGWSWDTRATYPSSRTSW